MWQAAPATTTLLVTPPSAEPLALDLIKGHLRVVDYADDDALILTYAKVAREYTETALGLAMLPQTWDQWWDKFPSSNQALSLIRQPVASITSLTYTDSLNVVQTITAGTGYVFDGNSDDPRIAPAFGSLWPSTSLAPLAAVKARYVAGYANPDAVPWLWKQMVLVLTAHWYENRSDVEIDNRLRALEIPRQWNDLALKVAPPLLA